MSRQWFKVATKIKDDPAMIRMSDRTFKAFIFILALAAERDADGEVCRRDDLALMLRLPEKAVKAALVELDGRVAVEDGVVSVRDWLQWQSPSRQPEPPEQVAERQRKSRASRKGHANVTQRDENESRDGHASLEIELEKEGETDPNGSSAASAGTPPEIPLRDDQLMFALLAHWLDFALEGMTPKTRGRINALGGKLRTDGFDLAGIGRAKDWWEAEDWRGKKGQAPTFAQLAECVEQHGRLPVPVHRVKDENGFWYDPTEPLPVIPRLADRW